MRTDIMMWLAPKMSARDAVMLVLTSDYEIVMSKTGNDGGIRPRTLESLQRFNSQITRMTLWRLMKDKLVEPEKDGFRLRTLPYSP